VEYNTIASSMGVLSEKVAQMQNHIMEKYADQLELNYKFERFESTYLVSVVNKIKLAVDSYCESVGRQYGDVLFMVEDDERNILDQKTI
jgi:hypothetical protein